MTAPRTRSPCPVACTLDRIGDKWTMLIVRDLFAGKSHFAELARSPEGIASNILADRLSRLQSSGIIEATASPTRAGSSAYSLTPRGRELLPVLKALAAWGLANVHGTEARISIAPATRRARPRASTRGRDG